MRFRYAIGATAFAAALLMTVGSAAAFDESKYPDLKGQWRRASNSGLLAGGAGGLRYDDSKPAAPTPLARTGAAADAGISGHLRCEPGRYGKRRPGRRPDL